MVIAMMKMKVDIDGVLRDMVGQFIPLLKKLYGLEFKYSDFDCYFFCHTIGKYVEDFDAKEFMIKYAKEIFFDAKPHLENIEALKELYDKYRY